MPFSRELVKEAFVYPEDIYPVYQEMEHKLRLNLCNRLDDIGLKIQAILREMVDAGLKWNVLGMNLSAILDKRSSSIKREHIDLLHELYFQFNKHDLLHWGVDFTHQLDKDPSSDKGDGIDNLDTDGFLNVEDFGLDDAVLNSLTDTSDSRDFNPISQGGGYLIPPPN